VHRCADSNAAGSSYKPHVLQESNESSNIPYYVRHLVELDMLNDIKGLRHVSEGIIRLSGARFLPLHAA